MGSQRTNFSNVSWKCSLTPIFISIYLHTHLADVLQGAGPLTGSHWPLFEELVPIHQLLQSKISGWPMSLLWAWSLPASGFDSTSSPLSRQASPNMRPLGSPFELVPTWQPAMPGFTPSESFQYVVFQSVGLNSNVPFAPGILRAPFDGGWPAHADIRIVRNDTSDNLNKWFIW